MGMDTASAQPGKAKRQMTPAVRPNFRSTAPCDYGEATDDTVCSILNAVTARGGAVMFGRTADGGAYSVCILMGDEKLKEYPSSPEQLAQFWMWVRDVYLG